MSDIFQRVIGILEQHGISANVDENTYTLYIKNKDEISSLTFISVVVSFESEFKIQIPDEFLSMDFIDKLPNIIYELKKEDFIQ